PAAAVHRGSQGRGDRPGRRGPGDGDGAGQRPPAAPPRHGRGRRGGPRRPPPGGLLPRDLGPQAVVAGIVRAARTPSGRHVAGQRVLVSGLPTDAINVQVMADPLDDPSSAAPAPTFRHCGVLAPEGPFTEQALLSQTDLLAGSELVALSSIPDVLAAVTD